MYHSLKQAFTQEMAKARDAYRCGDLDLSFQHLEQAHILGQRFFWRHVVSHWWMLKVGLRQGRADEIRGQLLRLIATVPGYLFGWIPKGNTGGANVSPVKPMPLPTDLAPLLENYKVGWDVARRLTYWALLLTVTVIWVRGDL
jgi:Protein of unknown function (DUF3703)